MMGDSQRFLEITASVQSRGMALSEWADAQPEPWATVLRFAPISGAFLLGLILVLLWKRKLPTVSSVEVKGEPQVIAAQAESGAEEKLPLLQNELKITLEKNKHQKELIASAKRALEVKDQELEVLKSEKAAANDAILIAGELIPEKNSLPGRVERRKDLQKFAVASGKLVKAAEDFRQNLRAEKSEEDTEPAKFADWDELLLFRSSDPSIWNQSVSEGENRYAVLLSEVPDNVAYLRLRRLDSGESVVISVQTRELNEDGGDHITGFNGSNEEFYGARHLGIYSEGLSQQVEIRFAYGGWGFGHRPNDETAQAFAWAGQEIKDESVMEITVFPRSPGLTDNDQLIEPS